MSYTVNVPINLPDDILLELALKAHELDITLNQFCLDILNEYVNGKVDVDIAEYERDYIMAGMEYFIYLAESEEVDPIVETKLGDAMYAAVVAFRTALLISGFSEDEAEETLQEVEWRIDDYCNEALSF